MTSDCLRLAITVSGAVSLGSYEAGALYEVVTALGQHNAANRDSSQKQVVIDVLTGASAGGMTATIAAQKLLFDAGSLQEPYENAFYNSWVVDADLEGLLKKRPNESALMSILSSGLVVDISREQLTKRYESSVRLPRVPHAAAAAEIRLGLALANLNGVDYGLPLHPSGSFTYSRYQDELTVALRASAESDDTFAKWEPLRNAAVSCGAFPFAFQAVEVIRRAGEYTRSGLETRFDDPQAFAYTDGGVFNNEPLGLAKNLVDQIDAHLDVDRRKYLYIAPRPLAGTSDSKFTASGARFLPFAKRLVGAIFDQAQFQDWVSVVKTDLQVDLFNKRAEQLQQLLKARPESAVTLGPAASLLVTSLSTRNGETDLESEDQARSRLRAQFAVLYGELSPEAQRPWLDAILTLELAAQLATRDEMNVVAITSSPASLAGGDLFAFAGFFDRRYRDHDYDRGRTDARAMLVRGDLGAVTYPAPATIRRIDDNLDGLTLERMDRAVRERFRERFRNRAHEIMKEAGISQPVIGPVIREVIDVAFLKPALNKLLKL